MALSPQDQDFYEEKLSWKSFLRLYAATVLIGAVLWPITLYIMDWSAGTTSKWSSDIVTALAMKGFLLGTIVSIIMYLSFKFLLQMGWLPPQR